MKRHLSVLIVLATVGLAASSLATTSAGASASRPSASRPSNVSVPSDTSVRACSTPTVGHAACLARFRSIAQSFARGVPASTDRRTGAATAAAVSPPAVGYGPADIKSIYHLDTTRGAGQTVAIIDAYDNPRAEKDLAAYRAAWKLPPCTVASGCLRKINQRGGAKLPIGDPGWGVEIALDLDAVSAACPLCHILLVEADSPSADDLGIAVNRAVTAGAKIVSNSYGMDEFNGVRALTAKYYNHTGVAMVVSSGDSGFGPASFPASAPRAIAVGGTTVSRTARGWTQSAWSGAGSGCSAWFAKPYWQHDANCPMRTVADLSALADPDTGLAVYDTYGLDQVFGVPNGWVVVGGTSLAAPLIAGMIGLAGNAPTLGQAKNIYNYPAGLSDVVGGSNGYCGGDYLCTGVRGYDAPTGVGTPRGLGSL